MAKGHAGGLGPLDRLGEKITLLVSALDQLRAEQSRVIEDNQRLGRELEAARARLAEAEGTLAETANLREEREQIRSRVAEMLEQIEALNL